mmetsp:Transcript_6266/g.13543  ORF Transcript_6266/g.13543 Transcript_6266/m.13543 type:complete len:106 (+) Transcript_6266:147-464(+)
MLRTLSAATSHCVTLPRGHSWGSETWLWWRRRRPMASRGVPPCHGTPLPLAAGSNNSTTSDNQQRAEGVEDTTSQTTTQVPTAQDGRCAGARGSSTTKIFVTIGA